MVFPTKNHSRPLGVSRKMTPCRNHGRPPRRLFKQNSVTHQRSKTRIWFLCDILGLVHIIIITVFWSNFWLVCLLDFNKWIDFISLLLHLPLWCWFHNLGGLDVAVSSGRVTMTGNNFWLWTVPTQSSIGHGSRFCILCHYVKIAMTRLLH